MLKMLRHGNMRKIWEMVQMLIAIDKIWEIVREKTLGRISKGMWQFYKNNQITLAIQTKP